MILLDKLFRSSKRRDRGTNASQETIEETKIRQQESARNEALRLEAEKKVAQERRIALLRATANYVTGISFYLPDGISDRVRETAKKHRLQLLGVDKRVEKVDSRMRCFASATLCYTYQGTETSKTLKNYFPVSYPKFLSATENILDIVRERNEVLGEDRESTSISRVNGMGGGRDDNYLTPETLHIQRMQIIAKYDPMILTAIRAQAVIRENIQRVISLSERYVSEEKRKSMTREDYSLLRRQARIELGEVK